MVALNCENILTATFSQSTVVQTVLLPFKPSGIWASPVANCVLPKSLARTLCLPG